MFSSEFSAIPHPGEIVGGRYQIVSIVGRGGGGIVYKALEVGINRDVALKVLPPENQLQESAVRRFEREARIVGRLRHPNTVTVYEFNRTAAGLLYIAMEFVDGLPLKTLMENEGPLPPERAVHILKQVLKSLAEAHANGIVHRDLKPANVMLCNVHGESDFVKVLDFGVATALGTEELKVDRDVTRSADVVGTPKYMAPEQFRSEQLTPASDLYAVGCMLFEMLSGYSPFDGETLHVTIARHLFQPPPEPPEFVRAYPRLVELIDRLLNKQPAQRWQSAEEVIKALNTWREGANSSGVQAPRPNPSGLSNTVEESTNQPSGYSEVTNNSGKLNELSAAFNSGQFDASGRPYSSTPSFPHYAGVGAQNYGPQDASLVLPEFKRNDKSKILLVVLLGFTVLAAIGAFVALSSPTEEESTAAGAKVAPEPPAHTPDPTTVSLNQANDRALLLDCIDRSQRAAANSTAHGLPRPTGEAHDLGDPAERPIDKMPPVPDPFPNPNNNTPDNRVVDKPTPKELVSISFEYQPPDASVSVKGAKKSDCKTGKCTIRAEKGASLQIKLSAENRSSKTLDVKADKNLQLPSVVLFRITQ
ncbi:MAG: protein kinase [Myxococcota bacterium]|jgi:serine/threonine protein kinase|nr:protein kinase [Myxococcota bacterium]